jgi:hypothetical protein
MKNLFKLIGIIAIVAVIGFTMIACNKSGGSGGGGGGKTLNSPEALKEYLDSQPANSRDKPIKVSMTINDPMLKSVVDVINSAGKYVSLNITGNALTNIPDNAFYKCETLVSINIPNSVTRIEPGAFVYCTNLTSVIIPNGVTSIKQEAFVYCTSLTSVTIPNSVTIIEHDAFGGCYSLTSVTFQGTITSDNFGEEGYSPFDGDLREKYLAGGKGTYTTTAPVSRNSKWTKK